MKTSTVAAVVILVAIIAFGAGWFLKTAPTPPPTTTPPPTPSFLQQVKDKGELVVGTSADWPPYEYVSELTGEITGFDVEFVEEIADRMGVTVVWEDMDFDALIAACTTGRVDMIAAATELLDDRMAELDYTLSYYTPRTAFVLGPGSTLVISSLEDIGAQGLKVGLQTGTTQEFDVDDAVSAGTILEGNVLKYPKADVLFMDLLGGAIDVAFVDEPPALQYTTQYGMVIAFTRPAYPNVFYFPKGADEFRDEVNWIMSQIEQEGVLDQLIAKWFIGG